MQFTEVSELNSNIDFARLGFRTVAVDVTPKSSGDKSSIGAKKSGYVSPFFQDEDPTIAKLLNNSPPVEAFYPAKAEGERYVQQLNQRRIQQLMLLQRQAQQKEQQEQAKQVRKSKVKEKKGTKKDEAAALVESNKTPSPKFKRLNVSAKQKKPVNGLLSKLMKSVDEAGAAGETGPLISVAIYFPDRTRLDVKVGEEATVETTIKVALKQYKARTDKDRQPMHQAQLYELRLHDGDGMPDEDFPALENNGLIANFWDEDEEAEFCLCERSGISVLPSSEEEDESSNAKHTRQVTSSSLVSEHMRKLENATAAEGFTVLKVFLPDNGQRIGDSKQYTIVQIPRGFKAYDLLAKIQSKQRLPLFKDEYLFRISETDRQRLGRLTGVLAVDEDVYELGVNTLELFRRKYADAPEYLQAIERAREAQAAGLRNQGGVAAAVGVNDAAMEANAEMSVDGTVDSESEIRTTKSGKSKKGRKYQAATLERREDPENFLFNELTSAVYQEWEVVKTNKWGKRQKRVMGIDHEKIYNRHRVQAGRGKLSNMAVKRAERNIADVLEIKQVENNPSAFTILYREGKFVESDRILLEYEAEDGPAAAALIIAKIKHNLARLSS